QAFSYTRQVTDSGRVKLHWSVAPGYYLYRSRLKVEGVPSSVESVRMPSGTLIHDRFFGDQRVFKRDFTIAVIPGDASRIELTWQAYAEQGPCYPPQHASIELADVDSPDVGRAAAPQKASIERIAAFGESVAPTDSPAASDRVLAARLAHGSTAWT